MEPDSRSQKPAGACAADRQLLKRLGRQIREDLATRGGTVESLATQSDLARSTLMEIIAGRSNPRILTLSSLARGLGYKGIVDLCHAAFSERPRELSADSSIEEEKIEEEV